MLHRTFRGQEEINKLFCLKTEIAADKLYFGTDTSYHVRNLELHPKVTDTRLISFLHETKPIQAKY